METPEIDAGATGIVTLCPDAAVLGAAGHPPVPIGAHPHFLLRELNYRPRFSGPNERGPAPPLKGRLGAA